MKLDAKKFFTAAPFIFLVVVAAWTMALLRFPDLLPPVGTYVAILAFLATVVAFWTPPERGWARVAWASLFAWLMFLEIHNLYRDRAQHDREQNEARRQEDDRFANVLKQNQDDFSATMNSMRGLLSEATGGNSYIFYDMSFVAGPIEAEIPGSRLWNHFP